MLGYFEGIDSERGIAWQAADSLSLRAFLGYDLHEATPDHSTLSRTRRLIDLETHEQVFRWVLKVLAEHDLIRGKTVGIDATTLEANAAMRSIVRRDTKETYQEFLTRLAKASGIETPTREDLATIDKGRKNKASNKDWEHPHDPDARIAKMKDGTTHLAHKVEHAVDLGEGASGAVLAVTLQGADQGDTATLLPTVGTAVHNLRAVADDPATQDKIAEDRVAEVVTDKGYHSNETMTDLAELEMRSYVPEPERGRRDWEGKEAEREAVYANRRRVRGRRGKRLAEAAWRVLGAVVRARLRDGGPAAGSPAWAGEHSEAAVGACGRFNLSLVMRKLVGRGTPRGLQGVVAGWRGYLAGRVGCARRLGRSGTTFGGPRPVL